MQYNIAHHTLTAMILVAGICFTTQARAQQQGETTTQGSHDHPPQKKTNKPSEHESIGWQPEWGVQLTSELQASHRGDYNLAHLLRLQANLPIARHLSFSVGSLSACMTSPKSIGGELQTFSNLDAGNIPFALSIAGFEWQVPSLRHRLDEERHTLFLGIRNMNEDYFASEVTSFFINSSWGIYPTIGANYDIANYPLASVGVHYRYEHPLPSNSESEHLLTLQTSLYNGQGYRNFSGRDNVFRFCPHGDGLFALAEVQYEHRGSHYFLGTAMHFHHGTQGTPWAYVEQRLAPSLHLIVAYSHAFATDAACRDFAGIGALWLAGRSQVGFFTDYARFSQTGEWATELSYKFDVSTHFSLQPSAHAILTGGKFTGALGLRLTAEF